MQSEGLTQPQFAAALGVSPTTVKRALARAVRDAGHDALAIDGVVGGRGFSAQRRVARGGEPWRFALAGSEATVMDAEPSPAAPDASPSATREQTGVVRGPTTPANRVHRAWPFQPEQQAALAGAAEQIAWLRAEIERRDAELEREQLANAELRRLLLADNDAAQPPTDGEPNAAPPAQLDAVERAAHEAGIGKKQRRELLARLAALAPVE